MAQRIAENVWQILAFERRRITVHLADGDTFVLAAVLDNGPVPLPLTVKNKATTFSLRSGQPSGDQAHGRVLCGQTTMRLTGLRIRPGGTRLVLGDHRMAATARTLGMAGRALCTITATKLSAELGEWPSATG